MAVEIYFHPHFYTDYYDYSNGDTILYTYKEVIIMLLQDLYALVNSQIEIYDEDTNLRYHKVNEDLLNKQVTYITTDDTQTIFIGVKL